MKAPQLLTRMINYQEGAVVSREIVKQEGGTVTLFAFDVNQGLSEHTAPYDALVQIVEGEAEITIAGEKQVAKTGEIILMPANQPHSLRAITAFKMVLTMIKAL